MCGSVLVRIFTIQSIFCDQCSREATYGMIRGLHRSGLAETEIDHCLGQLRSHSDLYGSLKTEPCLCNHVLDYVTTELDLAEMSAHTMESRPSKYPHLIWIVYSFFDTKERLKSGALLCTQAFTKGASVRFEV